MHACKLLEDPLQIYMILKIVTQMHSIRVLIIFLSHILFAAFQLPFSESIPKPHKVPLLLIILSYFQ